MVPMARHSTGTTFTWKNKPAGRRAGSVSRLESLRTMLYRHRAGDCSIHPIVQEKVVTGTADPDAHVCFSPLNQRTSEMSFDLKEIIAARLGENYELHHRHINRTLVAAQRVIGFDKVYARAEGAYLYDMDNNAY